MLTLETGQCGLCKHFGEHDEEHATQLVQIRTSKQAPPDIVEPCGHPENEDVDLRVTPISGCDGFEAAAA